MGLDLSGRPGHVSSSLREETTAEQSPKQEHHDHFTGTKAAPQTAASIFSWPLAECWCLSWWLLETAQTSRGPLKWGQTPGTNYSGPSDTGDSASPSKFIEILENVHNISFDHIKRVLRHEGEADSAAELSVAERLYLCKWSMRKASVSLLAFGSSANAWYMTAELLSSSASSETHTQQTQLL